MSKRRLMTFSLVIVILSGALFIGYTFNKTTEKQVTEEAQVTKEAVESTVIAQPNPKLQSNSLSSAKESASIFFLNSQEGWAICLEDKLCHTDDGGQTWKVISEDSDIPYPNFMFVDSKNGWGSLNKWRDKSYLVRTRDGGRTWHKVRKFDSAINNISFINEKIGYVSVYLGGIHRTEDGGRSWTEVTAEDDEDSTLKDRDSKDTNLEEHEEEVAPRVIRKVVAQDERRIWGYFGGLWYSEDGGRKWKEKIDYGETVCHFLLLDEKTGWAVGYYSTREDLIKGKVWRMVDGKNWEEVKIPESLTGADRDEFLYTMVSFISLDEGWILEGSVKLLHTRDGGRTWEVVYDARSTKKGIGKPIVFLDSMRGFALREGFALRRGELLRTMDGGRTWEVVQPIESKRK